MRPLQSMRLTCSAKTLGAVAVVGWVLPAAMGIGPSWAQRPEAPIAARMSLAREKIEAPLAQYMESAADTTKISVVILLKRQMTRSDRAALFDSIPAIADRDSLRRARRAALVFELKSIAQPDQELLIAGLNEEASRGTVTRIRPLWIVNAIGVRAQKSVIGAIAESTRVRSIHLDLPRAVGAGTAWGVTQIGADKVWATTPTGYTGNGRIVAILDYGVDYEHRDLKDRLWVNRSEDRNGDDKFSAADLNGVDEDPIDGCSPNCYVDDVIGWNFEGWDGEPTDAVGHGTLIAGIAVGDGTSGTATGVAPGASLMVLRISTSGGLVTEQDSWLGMQYAAEKAADVVNFSSGWRDDQGPAFGTWRQAVDNLQDAGTMFVTVAHNDGNLVGTDGHHVRTPGTVPLALTVGATDASDVIWASTNSGPVTWEDVVDADCKSTRCDGVDCDYPECDYGDYTLPPGLVKPDVSAPGVTIETTGVGAGYVTDSGTSFAAPHATGVAALLREKDPGLTPYEMKFILEETADRVGAAAGTSGPPEADVTYGWGRINAEAALAYNLDRTPYDLSITGTDALWTTEDIWVQNDSDADPDDPIVGGGNQLYAKVRNLGGEVPSDVEVAFYYADVATTGIDGFDPNGDGDPSDGDFIYIDSYRIPTLGPVGSRHQTADAVVNWSPPDPGASHWCVGVAIIGHNAINDVETKITNNVAFRNFFDIETGTTAFAFEMAPYAKAKTSPFAIEIQKKGPLRDVKIVLIVDRNRARQVFGDVRGMKKVVLPGTGTVPPTAARAKYLKALTDESNHTAYAMDGDRALLRGVRAKDGRGIPARLLIVSPPSLPAGQGGHIIVSAVNGSGKKVGGFTLRLAGRR